MMARAHLNLRGLLLCMAVASCHAFVLPPVPSSGIWSRLQPTRVVAVAVESFPLHEEAATGDANAVELMLAAGFPCDARNARGSTPLHIAAVHGHAAALTALLDAGASPNAANEDVNTPLHAAVGAGQLACARLLLSRGADADAVSGTGLHPLRIAARKGDASMMSALRDAGAEMDENAVQEAFWAAVAAVESTPEDGQLSAEVPGLLHHVFDADLQQLLGRAKQVRNVTCMQPARDGLEPEGGLMDDALAALPLRPGRACDGGSCCDACSRVMFPAFATPAEVDAFLEELQHAIVPPLHQFSLAKCAFRDARTTLIFVRLVERMRRAVAHEYGLPLSTVTPMQTFVSCFQGAKNKQGGLHSDESTHREFHYSAVLYLSTRQVDFEGGSFAFSDAPEAADPPQAVGTSRVLTPLSPSKGSAVVFSSGWENMHEVEPLVSGTRFAVPSFFSTCPVIPHDPPANDAEVADELWRTLLFPKTAGDQR